MDMKAAHTDLPIHHTSPKINENSITIWRIKGDKPESIPAEVPTSDTEVVAKILHVLFRKIKEKE